MVRRIVVDTLNAGGGGALDLAVTVTLCDRRHTSQSVSPSISVLRGLTGIVSV